MKYFDIKPAPETAYKAFQEWQNWTTAKFVRYASISKKILIKQENNNDYEFVFIDRGNGVKGMAVF